MLSKYKEMQVLRDNTVSVRKVTKAIAESFDDSCEKYAKLAFATDQIAFPTCLMVLPYSLTLGETSSRPIVMPYGDQEPSLTSCMIKLGKCLLEINKVTARLSFWLMMSGKIKGSGGNEFKFQLQEWLKRARYESCASIATEIVNGLGCGTNYTSICEEVLATDGKTSQAKLYMRDPIRAARKAFKQSFGELSSLYQSPSYFYLVDEISLVPTCAPRDNQGALYPIQIEPTPKLISHFLPFMSTVVMKALAKNKLEGLSVLLGLPSSLGIPDSWQWAEPGLVHSTDNSNSIEDFTNLQKVIRKDDLTEFLDVSSACSGSRANMSHSSGMSSAYNSTSSWSISALGLANIDLSPGDPTIAALPMTELELFFREHDPQRNFGKLRRVTSGNLRKQTGLWTRIETIAQINSMVEIADLEEQLRELNMTLEKGRNATVQYSSLLKKRNLLKKGLPNSYLLSTENDFDFEAPFDKPTEHSEYHHQIENNITCLRSSINEQQLQDERLKASPHRVSHGTSAPCHTIQQPHIDSKSNPKMHDSDASAAKKKKRSKSRRFRPWFAAC